MSKYCLAHLFTHQTFKSKRSSVLGLAYIASPRSYAIGGICSPGEYFLFTTHFTDGKELTAQINLILTNYWWMLSLI